MRILLINHYAGSLKYGMEYRPYYLAREWLRMGHHPFIVASSVSHVRTENPKLEKLTRFESVDGIPYTWLKSPSYSRNGVRRAANIIAFVGLLSIYSNRLIKVAKPNIVIASSTYPLDIVPARYIANRAKARLVYEVHDLWPLSPVELGGMSKRHPFILLMQWAENYTYKHADTVVSMLPMAADHMVRHGMSTYKFKYVPNGIDVEQWDLHRIPIPAEHASLIECLRRHKMFILMYAGTHGTANALMNLVNTASLLKGRPVAVVFVGSGHQKLNLQKEANKMNCSNLFFLPPVSKSSVPQLLALADATYIGWLKKPIYRFGISPNKLFDYMMAAKPVIHAIDSGNDIVTEAGCGISVPAEDPRAAAQAVVVLMGMSEEKRRFLGENGRQYVLANHDYRVLARRFLESVCHEGK